MAEDAGEERAPGRGRHLGRVVAAVLAGAVVVVALAAWRIDSLRATERADGSIDVAIVDQAEASSDGVVSVHGQDYAYDVQAARIVVCDEERDGRPVKAQYETAEGEIEELFDVSVERGDCVAVDVGEGISRHRMCEANLTWTCHNWQSTEKTIDSG